MCGSDYIVFCTLQHVLVCFQCELQCVAVYCSVLQSVAVSSSVLLCVAVCCSVLQCVAVFCSVLQCVAVCCSVLQCVAVCCSMWQCVAVCCSVLQCFAVNVAVNVAVCFDVLQCATCVAAPAASGESLACFVMECVLPPPIQTSYIHIIMHIHTFIYRYSHKNICINSYTPKRTLYMHVQICMYIIVYIHIHTRTHRWFPFQYAYPIYLCI